MPNPTPDAKVVFAADGWRKRRDDFYSRVLAPGVIGVLALSPNRGLPYQWRLQPLIGVGHERVDALARALIRAQGANPYPTLTISRRLVKLVDGPEARERASWLVAAEAPEANQRVFREVAAAVREVGLPWVEKRASLDALIYELRGGNAHGRCTPSLTVALWMKGEVAAAEAQLDLVASQFGAPAPPVPEPLRGMRVVSFGSSMPPEGWPRAAFDAFAARLRQAMAEHPTGPPDGWSPDPD